MNYPIKDIQQYLIDNGVTLINAKYLEKGHGVRDAFGLYLVGSGVTRRVYHKKYCRSVLKIGDFHANRYEYALYQIFKDTSLGKHLAKCISITPDGMILEQEYIRTPIPSSFADYYTWSKFQDKLESFFQFWEKDVISSKISDLHEDNFGITSGGVVKILDYSYSAPAYFMDKKSRYLSRLKKSLKKYADSFDPEFSIFIDNSGYLVLKTSESIERVQIKHGQESKSSMDGCAPIYGI